MEGKVPSRVTDSQRTGAIANIIIIIWLSFSAELKTLQKQDQNLAQGLMPKGLQLMFVNYPWLYPKRAY